jgi:hypothetical protein
MTTNISGSATIYTFPPRGRFAQKLQNSAAPVPVPIRNAGLLMAAKVAAEDAWYHQDAIEAERQPGPRRTN